MIDLQEEAVVLSDQVVLVIPPLGVVLVELVLVLGDDGADESNLASPPLFLSQVCALLGNLRA